jgi:diguanylate cyclase (GGDEF)-like protein
MNQVQVIRIVVASPGDVQTERDILPTIIEELNRGTAVEHGIRLELSRWETDSYPGFHPEGPQGLIDGTLHIEDCDVLIGIFWKRFGTPTKDARSGTEHEIQRAYSAWKQKGRPQIMVYFNQRAYAPKSKEETDQWGQVLEFQRNFPEEGLWWTYKSKFNFESLVRNHLTQFIRNYSNSLANPASKEILPGRSLESTPRIAAGELHAIYKITSAIRDSLDLPYMLQTTVDEVCRALGVPHAVLQVEGEHEETPLTVCYFRNEEQREADRIELTNELDAYTSRFRSNPDLFAQDTREIIKGLERGARPVAVAPLIYHGRYVGVLMVRSDEAARVWQDNEIFLMQTVADQVAIAISQARLFGQMQHLALTDSITGCVNRRSFELQLERDLRLATRMRQPISLIMIDLDHFKDVNASFGYKVGDAVLGRAADLIREELRGVDTLARFGSADFALILPQAGTEGAAIVSERIRGRIEQTSFPEVNHVTASLGVATFPLHADSRDSLVEVAHQSLSTAKQTGRNRVCLPPKGTLLH